MKKIFYSLILAFMAFAANAQPYNVTISIDMTSYTGPSFDNVMINGGFKGWGDALSLTNTEGNLWTLTVTMNEGINDYRFEIGGGDVGWNAEWEGKTSTGDCFLNPWDYTPTNMRWTDVTEDVVLPTVSWESCGTANSQHNVTISVDMTSYTGPSFDNVMMNGGFKGWGDALSLTNIEGNLWTLTVTMNEGINDYRFEIGGGDVGWNAEWEGVTSTGDCFLNPWDYTQTNMRWIDVTEDVELPTVSWESCDCISCTPTSTISVEASLVKIMVDNSKSVIIQGLAEGTSNINIYDIQGKLRIAKTVQNEGNVVLDCTQTLDNGIYIVKIETEKGPIVEKLMIN